MVLFKRNIVFITRATFHKTVKVRVKTVKSRNSSKPWYVKTLFLRKNEMGAQKVFMGCNIRKKEEVLCNHTIIQAEATHVIYAWLLVVGKGYISTVLSLINAILDNFKENIKENISIGIPYIIPQVYGWYVFFSKILWLFLLDKIIISLLHFLAKPHMYTLLVCLFFCMFFL